MSQEDEPRPSLPLGDFSSNLFAVLLLVFLALAIGRNSGEPQPQTRKPLSAAGLVALLHARTHAGFGPRVDVLSDRVVLIDEVGHEQEWPAQAPEGAARLRGLAGSGEVRLYVLSHGAYATARAALAGAAVVETTAPSALVERDAAGRLDWSPAFRRLIASRADLAGFSRELAALLEGGAGEANRARGDRAPEASEDQPARWRGWLRGLSLISAVAFAFVALGLIERGTRLSGYGYGRAEDG